VALLINGYDQVGDHANWNTGINFGVTAIDPSTPDTRKHAIALPFDNDITWYASAGTIAGHLTVDSTNRMQAVAAKGFQINACTFADTNTDSLCSSTTAFFPTFKLYNRANDATGGYLIFQKDHNPANPVQNGDALGTMLSQGYANGALANAAYVGLEVAGAPSGSNIPSRIRLATTDAGGDVGDFLLFDQASHLFIGPPGVAAITSCGTSPSVARGSDVGGEVTEGTTSTGCVISFKVAYAAAPYCVVTSQAVLVNFAYTISNVAITVSHNSADSAKLDWVCIGQS
jgi:hypothetical protein